MTGAVHQEVAQYLHEAQQNLPPGKHSANVTYASRSATLASDSKQGKVNSERSANVLELRLLMRDLHLARLRYDCEVDKYKVSTHVAHIA